MYLNFQSYQKVDNKLYVGFIDLQMIIKIVKIMIDVSLDKYD